MEPYLPFIRKYEQENHSALNGKIVSNEIDKHLQDIDALIPLEGLSIMGDYDAHQKRHSASLFGKMSDLQVNKTNFFGVLKFLLDIRFGERTKIKGTSSAGLLAP